MSFAYRTVLLSVLTIILVFVSGGIVSAATCYNAFGDPYDCGTDPGDSTLGCTNAFGDPYPCGGDPGDGTGGGGSAPSGGGGGSAPSGGGGGSAPSGGADSAGSDRGNVDFDSSIDSDVTLFNPLGDKSIGDIFLAILDIIMVFAVPIILFFLVWAGFLYVTAQGSEEKLRKAHRALLYAVIGGLLVLGAQTLLYTLTNTIELFDQDTATSASGFTDTSVDSGFSEEASGDTAQGEGDVLETEEDLDSTDDDAVIEDPAQPDNIVWPEEIDLSNIFEEPNISTENATLVSSQTTTGSCADMLAVPHEAALNNNGERIYVMYTDPFGNEKIVDVTDEETSTGFTASVDKDKIPFDLDAGTNRRVIHTHPRSTTQQVFDSNRKGPSIADLEHLCVIEGNGLNTEDMSYFAIDADTVWQYALTDPTKCPLDNEQFKEVARAEIYGILKEVPSSERQAYAERLRDGYFRESGGDIHQSLEEGSTMTTAELDNAQQNLLAQNGFEVKEVAPEELCSDNSEPI